MPKSSDIKPIIIVYNVIWIKNFFARKTQMKTPQLFARKQYKVEKNLKHV